MTSTINHPFTVRIVYSCIDLRALSGKIPLNLPNDKGFHTWIVRPEKKKGKEIKAYPNKPHDNGPIPASADNNKIKKRET